MLRRTLLGAGLAASAGGCSLILPELTFRYRLRLVMSVDGEERVGESVLRLRVVDQRKFSGLAGGIGFSKYVRGEAPFVELGHGLGALFALVRTLHEDYAGTIARRGDPAQWPFSVEDAPFFIRFRQPERQYRFSVRPPHDWDHMWDVYKEAPDHREEVALPEDKLPALVRFGNIAEPSSVERVRPSDFARRYDGRVELRRVTLQMTSDRPQSKISRVLPWLHAMDGSFARSNVRHGGPIPLSHEVNREHFSRSV